MSSIICDTSPLIFLAKVDQLDLVAEVLDGDVFVLQVMVDELCSEGASDVELLRLNRFFETVSIVDYVNPAYPSQSLSENDRSLLNWSIANRPDWIVVDEQLLRRIAVEEALNVIGLFGILIKAASAGIRPVEEIKGIVDDVVGQHGCRISVALYRRILEELEKL